MTTFDDFGDMIEWAHCHVDGPCSVILVQWDDNACYEVQVAMEPLHVPDNGPWITGLECHNVAYRKVASPFN